MSVCRVCVCVSVWVGECMSCVCVCVSVWVGECVGECVCGGKSVCVTDQGQRKLF